jgi:5-methylcytosine-specific restriction protein A
MLKTRIPEIKWDRLQMSGTEARPPSDTKIERLWARQVRGTAFRSPEEGSVTFPEGTTTRVLVNRYERDPRARQACIDHYGKTCSVCRFDFDATYGPKVANGFIHVHHLIEISIVGKGYKVDPIKDLRPICPNCHAMAHTTHPARTIAALRRLISATPKP